MGQSHVQQKLILMVFIQRGFLLCVVLQPIDYIGLFHLLSDCSNIPKQVFSYHHAANTILILRVEDFLMLHFELYLAVLSKCVRKDSFNVFSEIFARAWHFCILDIVGNHDFFRFSQLSYLDWLNGFTLIDPNDNISLSNREISRLNIDYIQVDSHFFEEWYETKANAFEGGRSAHISSSIYLNLLIVGKAVDYWNKALHHEGATGSCACEYLLWLQEFGIEVNLCVTNLGHFLNKGTENGSKLVIDARVWSVLSNSHHCELFVEQQAQGK